VKKGKGGQNEPTPCCWKHSHRRKADRIHPSCRFRHGKEESSQEPTTIDEVTESGGDLADALSTHYSRAEILLYHYKREGYEEKDCVEVWSCS
jgi:hypothetical protein